jgi:hypothetical protein
MKIPSRRMPKAVEREAGPFGWTALCLLLGGLLYLFWSHPPVMGIVLVILAISAVAGRKHVRQMRQVAATRAGGGICEFAREFNARVTDTWIIRAVYEEVQACLGSEFPLRAHDRLEEDLYIHPDDLDVEIVMRVAERTGRSLREPERNPYYQRIVTAGDLVNFFNNQPYSVPASRVV